MAGLKINLTGEFRVWRGGDLVQNGEWNRRKTRSLLKLLLVRPGRTIPRDVILEALLPGVAPKAADQSLRVTVSLLRRALEPDLERGSDSRYVLQRQPGYVFDREAGCKVDAWEFEEHQRKARAARGAGRVVELRSSEHPPLPRRHGVDFDSLGAAVGSRRASSPPAPSPAGRYAPRSMSRPRRVILDTKPRC